MSLVDPGVVRRIAHLARLKFNDEEVEEYGTELSKILDHVAVLETLPETTVSQTDPGSGTPERQDNVTNAVDHQPTLRNAPDQSGTYFRVPLVINEES